MMSPIIFHLGPIEIRLYGILFALALAQGIYLFKKFARQKGLTEKFVDSYLFWLALSLIIGARLGEVFFYEPAYYFSHPLEIFAVWHGGLASHGALIAGIMTTFIFAKKLTTQYAEVSLPLEVRLPKMNPLPIRYTLNAKRFLLLADLAAIPIALGGAMVRIANFFNAEIVGLPTTLPWAVTFAGYDFPRHPVQLYEAAALLVTAFLLWIVQNKSTFCCHPDPALAGEGSLQAADGAPSPLGLRDSSSPKTPQNDTKNGILFFLFLLLYLSARFFLEFLKDMPHVLGPFTTSQLLSAPFMILACVALITRTYHTTHT